MKPLISVRELVNAIGSPDLFVFDATKYLPNESKDGYSEFLASHIPGSYYFDIDKIADQDTDLPHMVPSPGRFAKLLSAMGVSNASRVVFYDQKGLASAARGWWLMRLFGHDRVSVLDGGLPKWMSQDLTVDCGTPSAPNSSAYRPDFRAKYLRGIGDMLDNLKTNTELVLDARAAGRFSGITAEPRAGMRSGHIPGSVNIPYTDLLCTDGTFQSPEKLRARFAIAGVDGKRPVVTSCGSGVSAAILTLGLCIAGLPYGALYDGSWSEWGGRLDTPVDGD